MVEAYVKERNDALFSLDRNKIEAYCAKHGDTESADMPDLIFWAGVFKAICAIKNAPEDKVQVRMGIRVCLNRLVKGFVNEWVIIALTQHIGHDTPVTEIQNGAQIEFMYRNTLIPFEHLLIAYLVF